MLTPAQQRVVTDLMALGAERPRFPAELADGLRRDLEEELAPLADTLAEPMWVTKRDLGNVHVCEGHYRAERDEPFGWNVHNVEGTVVHRALELSISARGTPAPLELVDHALDSLVAGDGRRAASVSAWLDSIGALELADLRARVNDVVVKFHECWPPLAPKWSPRTETAIGADLCGERVVLRGRVDLLLGVARGDEARVLVVDLKTGRARPGHLDDLRFYALVQTLRVGVPPFRIASYYLDTATFHSADVTVDALHSAVRRVVDGARRMIRLADRAATPTLTAGPTCGWCRLRADCEMAQDGGGEAPTG